MPTNVTGSDKKRKFWIQELDISFDFLVLGFTVQHNLRGFRNTTRSEIHSVILCFENKDKNHRWKKKTILNIFGQNSWLNLFWNKVQCQVTQQAQKVTCRQMKTWLPGGGGGVLPYSLGGGVPLGSRKSYPLLDQILQMLWPYTRVPISISSQSYCRLVSLSIDDVFHVYFCSFIHRALNFSTTENFLKVLSSAKRDPILDHIFYDY